MRKVKIILICTFICLAANAQVFFEDFKSGIPAAFKIYDQDKLTPNQSMAGLGFSIGKGWISYSLNDPQGSFAASTSKYDPAGTSDDWLVTPRINIPSNGYFLEWKAIACSKTSLPNHKVFISTSGTDIRDFSEIPIFETGQEESQWTFHAVPLNNYSGKNIYIAFVNTSTDKYLLGIDDIKVLVPHRISSLVSTTAPAVGGITEISVSGRIYANYSQPVTSFTASYTSKENTVVQEFSGLRVNPGEEYSFEFNKKLPASPGDTVRYSITVSTGTEKHVTDTETVCYAFVPKRLHIIEEATGTWCGFCPAGHVAMEYMRDTYPDSFTGIAVHNADPMTVKAYDSGLYSLGIEGYPTGFVNRKYKSSPLGSSMTPGNGGFETWYLKAQEEFTPASITLTGEYTNSGQAEIRFHTKVTFALNLPQAKYNLAFVIKECNVKGTTVKYNQNNYYAGSDKQVGGFEKLPTSIPAQVMVYQDVARAVKPSFKGEPIINKSIQTGEEVTFDYTISLPESILDKKNVSFIALLLDARTGEIVNAGTFGFGSHEHSGLATSIRDASYEVIPEISVQTEKDGCVIEILSENPVTVSAGLYGTGGSRTSIQKNLPAQTEHRFKLACAGLKGVYILKLCIDGKPVNRKIIF